MKKLIAALVLLATSVLPAFAQNGANVRQSGNVTPGHVPMWTTSGVIQDGGTAAQGFLTSLGVTNNGGPGICINSAPITQPYNRLCLSASTSGSSTLSLQNLGGATAQTFAINVNGVNYPFPGAGTGFATGPGCIPIGTGNADEFLSDCTTATGTANAIILTPTLGPIPTTLQLVLFTRYTFQAAASNSGPTTIRMGASGPGPYNVYTNSGVALAGGEIIVGSWYTMGFDPALNSNAGGWRIIVGFEASGTGVTFVQGGTGAATRTMQGKVRESVSVLDYTNTGLAAVCGGVDAVDDSIAINKAIAYVGANGGGDVLFPPFTDCRIKNPINAVAGVHLVGQGALNGGSTFASAIIYPSANLTAMILQPNLAVPISDWGLDGITLYGRKGSFTVTNLIRVSALNAFIKNSNITNGSGNCIQWDAAATPAWLNDISGNRGIGSCGGFSLSFSGSDSRIVNNEFGGSTLGNVFLAGAGSNNFTSNRVETSPAWGMIIQSPNTGDANCLGGNNTTQNTITGNIFAENETGILFQKGTCAGNSTSSDIVTGNIFTLSTTRDIEIDSGILNGHIGPNTHTKSSPSASYVGFIPGTTNTGWTVEGTFGSSSLTENRPADLKVDASGSQHAFQRYSEGPGRPVSNNPYGGSWLSQYLFSFVDNATHATDARIGISSSVYAVGSGTDTPAASDYSIYATVQKQNYLSSAIHGEIDSILAIAFQGKFGDAAAILAEATKVNGGTGGVLGAEVGSILVNSSNVIQQKTHGHTGWLSVDTGEYFGYASEAWGGTLTSAFIADTFNETGTPAWSNVLIARTTRNSANTYFKIDGTGKVFMANSIEFQTTGVTGTLAWAPSSTNKTITLPNGTTNFTSAGAGVVQQATSGAAFTVTTVPVGFGGTGLTSGTSGGVLAFTAAGTIASSGALTANLPVLGGGPGAAPIVGTRSGNTTAYVTTTGTQTSGNCVSIDASGNHIANGSACQSGTVTSIATTSPITGGTITTTGTIACATCVTSAAALTANQLMAGAGLQASAVITTGTGVLSALGINVGSAGALVTFNGALGTPSSGVATNLTGTAASLTAGNATNANITNVTSGATGFPTWVTANSTNLPLNVTSTKYTYNPSTDTLGVGVLAPTNSADYLDVGGWSLGVSGGSHVWFNGGNQMVLTTGGALSLLGNITAVLGSDTAQTDSSVCVNSSNVFLKGTGTLGICLGTSGRQFKTDEVPMTAGVNEISQLKLLNYRYKPGYGDGGERVQYGLVAQDVERVMPDLVRHGPDGEAINFDIGALLPVALKAIQELKADNDNLKMEVNKLKRRAAR